MSIEVRVPKEITDYKEKIIFNLSIRQLVCFTGAILTGALIYVLLSPHVSSDVIGYPIMLICAPFFAVGFIRYNGIYFERFIVIFFKHYFGNKKRIYMTTEITTATPLNNSRTGEKGDASIIKHFQRLFQKFSKKRQPEYNPARKGAGRRIRNERSKLWKIEKEIWAAKQDYRKVKRATKTFRSERTFKEQISEKEVVGKRKKKSGK